MSGLAEAAASLAACICLCLSWNNPPVEGLCEFAEGRFRKTDAPRETETAAEGMGRETETEGRDGEETDAD